MKTSIAIVILALAAPAFAQQTADVSRNLDAYVTAAAQHGRFTGSVLVARDGKVLLSKGYGMANLEHGVPNRPDTKFRIGSITKPFTAAAILQLQQQGMLNVQDPVCKHLAACPPAWSAITLHHLLSHTSGIPNYVAFPDFVRTMREPATIESLMARFRDKPLDFAPGSQYAYSNSGYVVLGAIVSRLTGMSYADFLQKYMLGPLQMTSTGYDLPTTVLPNRAAGYSRRDGAVINAPLIAMTVTHSAGALYSTVEDLLRFDQALYTDRLLTSASRDASFKEISGGYGYGWGVAQVHGRRNIAHTGGINGFTGILSRYPDDKVTIIVLANSDQLDTSAQRMGNDLAAIVFGQPYELPRARPTVTVPAALLDSYAGDYELRPGVVITVTRAGNRLTAMAPGQLPMELLAESEATFAITTIDAKVTFVRDGSKVTRLILHQGGDQHAKKIR